MAEIVQLTLTGRQRTAEGEETVTRTSLQAEYYEREDGFYLLYQEPLDENGSIARSCIRLKDSLLEITKKGAVQTRMVFEEGREYLTNYATSYGCLRMGIRTERLECRRQDSTWRLRTEYSLTSQGEPFSFCVMETEVCLSLPQNNSVKIAKQAKYSNYISRNNS